MDGFRSDRFRYFVPSEQLTGGANRPAAGNYRGDLTLAVNRGDHVPDDENTSLWITGLPPNVTYATIQDHIAAYQVGRVRSLVISPPTATSRNSAAAISFFRRRDAMFLFALIEARMIIIDGTCPRVQWNRNKVAEEHGPYSRVVLIAGSPEYVNEGLLDDLFREKFEWEDLFIIDHGEVDLGTGPIARLEYRFGSWRSQANWAYNIVRSDLGLAYAEYGADPCGP